MTGVKRKSTRQPPWEGPDAEGISFGGWLRQQREVRQIGLREVAEASKIGLRYLQAFEQDQFDLLPAPVFAKGFLRQYSEYVGLDADEVVNHYLWARRPETDEEEQEETPPPERMGLWPLVLVAFVLALAVAGFLWYSSERTEGPAAEAPRQEFIPPPPPPLEETSPPPEELPADSVSEEPAAPLRVNVEFSRDCWVDVVIDGRDRITQTFLPGEPLQIEAETSVRFRSLGNAGAVKIEVNGLQMPLAAEEGKVISDLRIDLETVAALAAGGP
jgi:cytoskeleton protein RodZ